MKRKKIRLFVREHGKKARRNLKTFFNGIQAHCAFQITYTHKLIHKHIS